jgi:energy-coupling factor transport system ATP-binding protein
MPEPIIQFKNVHFHYEHQKRWALKDISLDVSEGEFLGIIGRSGAGKSTLCLCVSALIPKFEDGLFRGDVIVNGVNTKSTSVGELSQTVGTVFQNPESQLYGLTVEEEIFFALENHGIAADEIERRVRWVLDAVGLDVPLTKSPFDLSGGQKQRLIIASTMALFPKIMVLDEPTTELDPAGKDSIYEVLGKLRQEGMTVVMVEHDIERLVNVADRIAVIDKGQLISVKPPRQLFNEDAKLLEELGLHVPQVFEVFKHILGEKAGSLPITIEESKRILSDKKWGKNG